MLAAEITEAEAAVTQARADADIARLNLGYTEIRSPVDGYVSNRAAQVSAYVPQAGYLVSITPARRLWVDANFKEDQLAGVVAGEASASWRTSSAAMYSLGTSSACRPAPGPSSA